MKSNNLVISNKFNNLEIKNLDQFYDILCQGYSIYVNLQKTDEQFVFTPTNNSKIVLGSIEVFFEKLVKLFDNVEKKLLISINELNPGIFEVISENLRKYNLYQNAILLGLVSKFWDVRRRVVDTSASLEMAVDYIPNEHTKILNDQYAKWIYLDKEYDEIIINEIKSKEKKIIADKKINKIDLQLI
ncbi:MAG: hypothetical protein CL775_00780 [Chloroflexi bacterium]|nr:hypothetical protein [Chloroflexota bacterium]|tara:strand:- start:2358 stop:2918 length:561 start_codon:yes stop_codon:yes gene_type:complete